MGRKTKAEEEKLRKMDEIVEKRKEVELKPPEYALSMRKEPGKGWIFVTYEVKNGKVVNESHKECLDKAHAIEVFKIDFVSRFFNGQ